MRGPGGSVPGESKERWKNVCCLEIGTGRGGVIFHCGFLSAGACFTDTVPCSEEGQRERM